MFNNEVYYHPQETQENDSGYADYDKDVSLMNPQVICDVVVEISVNSYIVLVHIKHYLVS